MRDNRKPLHESIATKQLVIRADFRVESIRKELNMGCPTSRQSLRGRSNFHKKKEKKNLPDGLLNPRIMQKVKGGEKEENEAEEGRR
jgi:hypothetical protein